MLNLPNYDIFEQIYNSNNTVIYRGKSLQAHQPVIIKTYKNKYPTLEEITLLKHEYQIAKNLDIEGIVKPYSLENYQNGLALVVEDFAAQSLQDVITSKKIELIEFLQIAIKLAQTLTQLHQHQIIHKDIKSSNILINPKTGQVKITDFAIATRLCKENHTTSNHNILEGTLAYMSPEQTGRMNRSIDYRTDYYSLGVTFYEMLTGQLPFLSTDPIELVHCHIAKKPVPPHQVNPEIPTAVSSIVMKLLAKNAEDRYQSALGLKYDLEFCLTQLQATGIPDFIVGTQDLSSQLLIPQKLYGRDQVVETLLAAFERVATGGEEDTGTRGRGDAENFLLPQSKIAQPRSKIELVLVSGYSGIGKSSLVNEIHKPIVQKRGYFIKGKFDQFKRNIPYAALIQAFQELIQQLLTESKAQIAVWFEKILGAIATNGQVIIDVIPEVELIIGTQPPVPQLGATESQNRFNRIFQQFVSVFTKKEHPLVLFLDDLQWADSASLNLIQLLITDFERQYLLLIGAYRDNEVSAVHPLMQTLDKIQAQGITVNNIILQPLNFASVHELITDTLGDTVAPRNFAELLFNKTGGNPFFLTQLLQTLYQEKLLTFDFSCGQWQWDIQEIQAIGITDKTVVELIASNIQKLPATTQEVLKLAACIGNSFSLDVLAIVYEKSHSTAADLWLALQAGLILPLSNAYKIPLVGEWEMNAAPCSIVYKFLHDRVQQAAYSLIPEEQKKETHLKIGQLLWENIPLDQLEANIFDIVNQLNLGAELITDQSKKYELAKLNLIAGNKAKAATAYEPAEKYLNVGLELLVEDSWTHKYELTLNLYVELVEAEYLCTNFERSKQLSEVALLKAKTLLDKVKLYEIIIQFHIAQNQMQAALDTGMQVLELLEVSLSIGESDTSAILLPHLEDLAAIPTLTNPNQLAALRLLMTIMAPAIITNQKLFSQIIVTVIKLCLEHGHAPLAACGYVTYGFFLCGVVGNLDSGYLAGQLGLKLLEQFKASELKSKVYSPFNGFTRHWKEHIKETLAPLIEGIQSGLETGDIQYAGYGAFHYGSHVFLVGEPLEFVEKQQASYIDLMLKTKQDFPYNYLKIWHQLTLNLQGKAEDKYCLIGESFNEEKMLPYLQAANNGMSLFVAYLAKAMLCYLFKNSVAVHYASCAAEYSPTVTGMAAFAAHNFYYSLALLAEVPHIDIVKQQQYINLVDLNQEKMRKWVEHAGMNYQHKYDLVEAELARVNAQFFEAMEYYDRAIKGAKEQGYHQEEALANELAAEFYLARGKEKIAQVYLTEAYYGYIRWGAIAKVGDLESRFPQFLSHITTRETTEIAVTRTARSTTTSGMAALDLATVLKASQAISEEIVLDKLLDKLMQIVMENTGAQKGMLFLQKSGKLILAALGSIETEEIVLPFVTVEEYTDLPISLINYVERTGEAVVLNNATQEGLFTEESYILKHQPQSILGLPIIYQGKLTGILYLENSLSQGAFTRDRLKVLSLLCTQVSISIENASLYKDLQSYSLELEQKNQALQQSSLREREKANALLAALQELQNTQLQLIQTEKLSSLGQMVAGIAHEINNPVNFINVNLSHASNYTQDLLNLIDLYQQNYPHPPNEIQDEMEAIDLEFLKEDLPKMLGSLKLGGDRIKEIVRSLRNFSRQDAQAVTLLDIHEGIDTTLMILQHRLRAQPHRGEIEIIKEYGDIPLVRCYAGLLNQVFMNLLANAIDAIEEGVGCGVWGVGKKPNPIPYPLPPTPQICIRTALTDNNHVIIRIADNGPGMTEEIIHKLFNPFFTTKPVGKGTGIGLSISRQIIVEKHQGQLSCISAPGQGAEFIIELPIN